MKAPHCRKHPEVALVCPACMGASTAGVTSKAKAKASARNGRLGGRPKLPKHSQIVHTMAGDASFVKRLENCQGCQARQ